MLIERSGGPVTILPAPSGGAFVVVGNQSCRRGRLRREARLVGEAVVQIAGSGAYAADRRTEHADRINEVGSSPARVTQAKSCSSEPIRSASSPGWWHAFYKRKESGRPGWGRIHRSARSLTSCWKRARRWRRSAATALAIFRLSPPRGDRPG